MRTIRNCPSATWRECPTLWDHLTPDESPTTRRCGHCDRPVYLCVTDEETVTHAKAGHCIAREEPTDAELGTEYVELAPGFSLPLAWIDGSPGQEEARRRLARERAINDAIRTVRFASRDCPRCHYPVPDYRVTCHICGFETGRVYDKDGNLHWAGG